MALTPRGFPYPVGTDAVVDGDNAIRSLAEFSDATVGMQHIRTVQVTGGQESFADDVMTPNFLAYRVIFNFTFPAVSGVTLQARKGGVLYSGAGYGNSRLYMNGNATNAATYAVASLFSLTGIAGLSAWGDLTLFNPMVQGGQKLGGIGMITSVGGTVGNAITQWGGHIGTADTYDGLRFAGGTMTGYWSIYGLR